MDPLTESYREIIENQVRAEAKLDHVAEKVDRIDSRLNSHSGRIDAIERSIAEKAAFEAGEARVKKAVESRAIAIAGIFGAGIATIVQATLKKFGIL